MRPDPHDPHARIEAAIADALLAPGTATPGGLVDPAGRPAPRRFAVHRNNVAVSLVEALVDTYPVVARLVGDAFFRAMAGLAARAHPPASPVLLEWGGALPGFIAAFPPAAGLPWLADVARLEWARVEAFHAADATPIAGAALTGLPPDAVARLRLTPHPSLRLIASPWPVLSLYAANRPGADPAATALDLSRAEDVLVIRPDLAVDLHALPAGGCRFVAALAAGARLAEAANTAGFADPAADLALTLAILIRAGAFIAARVDPSP